MRRALASLLSALGAMGPALAEGLYLIVGPAAGLIAYALSRQLVSAAQKLQSEDPPRSLRCPPGTTSSTR